MFTFITLILRMIHLKNVYFCFGVESEPLELKKISVLLRYTDESDIFFVFASQEVTRHSKRSERSF